MKAILFSQFVKQGGYETYDYKSSSSRNYTPPKYSGPPVALAAGSGSDESRKLSITPMHNPDMPKNGANKASYDDTATLGLDHSHARNTISGTGFGHQFWQEPKNGYGI